MSRYASSEQSKGFGAKHRSRLIRRVVCTAFATYVATDSLAAYGSALDAQRPREGIRAASPQIEQQQEEQ